MSLIIFKNNFPTKKYKVLFIDADSFKYYENMNNAIQNLSMNRQICILTKKQNIDELKNALIELSMFVTVIIYTSSEFINKSLLQSVMPKYNSIGSLYVGNINSELNFEIASKIGLNMNSIVHSGLFEKIE
jgi:ribulose kinase